MGVHRHYARYNNFTVRPTRCNLVELSPPVGHINLHLCHRGVRNKSFEPLSARAQETVPSLRVQIENEPCPRNHRLAQKSSR